MFVCKFYLHKFVCDQWSMIHYYTSHVCAISIFFFIHLLFLPLSVHLNNSESALLHFRQVSSQDYVLISYGKDHIQSDVVTVQWLESAQRLKSVQLLKSVQRLEFAHLNYKQFFSFFSQRKKIRCRQISWARKPHVKSRSTFYPQWSKLFV